MEQPKEFDEQTIASISDLGRQFSDATVYMHEAIAKKVGLSGTDHKYLGILIQRGAMTAGELAKLTGLTTGAVTGLVDRLEKKKLVKRQFDQEDRRKVLIVPDAQKAEHLLGGISAGIRSKVLNLLSNFDEHEIKIIERYLTSLIKIMKETANDLNEKGKKK
jgi:DNA-binding MarR family transcriptional regulator